MLVLKLNARALHAGAAVKYQVDLDTVSLLQNWFNRIVAYNTVALTYIHCLEKVHPFYFLQ